MDTSIVQEGHGKWIKMEDVHAVMASKPSYKDILFSDGKTKLLDCISNMEKFNSLKRFLQNMSDIDTSLPSHSCLWPGSTPLHLAVMYCENMTNEDKVVHLLKHFLNQEASVEVQNQLGATPLHLAFRLEQQHIVTLLLRNLEKEPQTVANPLDHENLSHLHIFCTVNDKRKSLARTLLNEPGIESTINAVYKGKPLADVKKGWTPLHVAVDKRQPSLVKLLLQRGASTSCKDARGCTPIHLLFGTTETKTLANVLFTSEQLEDCVAEGVGLTHLHVAVWFDDAKSVERLLDSGADVEATLGTVEAKNLKKKIFGCTPLHMAMILDYRKIVNILLQRGADILARKPDGTSPLSYGLTGRYSTRYTINSFIWSDEKLQKRLQEELGLTTLHVACYSCDTARVEAELKKGADVNARLHDHSNFWMGYTPLHALMAKGGSGGSELSSEKKVALNNLLQNNCDVDQQDSAGKTAISLSVELKDFGAVKALLSAGADVDMVDRSGKSAFSYAVEFLSLRKQKILEFENVNRIIVIIMLHLHKMKLLGIEASKLNKTLFNSTLQRDDAPVIMWNKSAFNEQVQASEAFQIGRRGLSLRSFLCDTRTVSLYPSLMPADRNELAAYFQSLDYRDFPEVGALLNLQYRKAMARLSLIDPARDALKNFICPNFPDLCVDIILKYLSNLQLKHLITASIDVTNT